MNNTRRHESLAKLSCNDCRREDADRRRRSAARWDRSPLPPKVTLDTASADC